MSEQDTISQCLDALLERDRLSYLGDLVQGFVHNINGPLQNMLMLVEILGSAQRQMDQFASLHCEDSEGRWENLSSRQHKRFGQLNAQIGRLAEVLRDFMLVHDMERNELQLEVNLVLTKLASVFQSDLFFKHQVRVELELQRNLPLVPIPGRHMIPALVHLFRNAITALRQAPEKVLTIASSHEADAVVVSFQDSGCGFALEPDAAFELFSSRWPEGHLGAGEHRAGLGLFLVDRFLSPYGVAIELKRETALTQVRLTIPLTGNSCRPLR